MGLFSQFALVVKSKTLGLLDRSEDPRQVLEYGYQEQQRRLVEVKRGLVEVAASKVRLERQSRKVRAAITVCEQQAENALELGREELAREALQRKHAALAELAQINAQATEIGGEEERLAGAQRLLARRIDEFRGHKTILAARYSSAQARVRAMEALAGISGEMAELNLALGRAEEKTDNLHARADALDAMVDADALAPPWGGIDALGRELHELVAARAVEAELDELRRRLGRSRPALELDEGSQTKGAT